MINEKNITNDVKDMTDELKALGLEAYETTTETMLEEMGASIGINGCCSIIIEKK
ncbi:hypothetical protein [Peptoanaerobacter stomatis]|uniref:hypothetical protein n=1 Tax=Peptoanaerobacter stomatis TaxID=796937 RepID=UPI003F9F7AC5